MEITRFGPDDADRLQQYVEVVERRERRRLALAAPRRPCTARRAGSGSAGTARSRRRTSARSTACPWRSGGSPPPTTTTCTWPGWGCRSTPTTGAAATAPPCWRSWSHEVSARGRTSIGIDGWDDESRGVRGPARVRAEEPVVERRQHLAELDWAGIERLHAEALGRRDGVRARPARGSHSRRRARGAGRDGERDQRRADRRPRHRGRGLLARPDARPTRTRQLAARLPLYRIFARHRETGSRPATRWCRRRGPPAARPTSTTRRS